MTKIEILRQYIAAYNHFDIESMLLHLSDDIIFINVTDSEKNTESKGKEEFRKLAVQGARLFTDRQQIIEEWQDDGAKVLCHITFKATLTDETCKQLKMEKHMHVKGTSEFHFDGGKICQIIDKS
jgi:ketosteroid isomerase-like protein